jgi:WD40 repeat protein/GTPase SAR1 family protein
MGTINSFPTGFALKYVLGGHQLEINRIAWSPDGRFLASSSFDKTVRIWDAHTGGQLQRLTGHTGTIFSVAWAPDGQILASGSSDKTVRLWNTRTGQELQVLQGHKKDINDLAWAPDGNSLLSASADFSIRLWQAPTWRLFRSLHAHSNEVYSIAWSPNNKVLASGSAAGIIRIWDRASLDLFLRGNVLRGANSSIDCLTWHPDSQTLASGSQDGAIRLWNIDSGRLLRTFEGHTAAVTSVSFSSDGRFFASKSIDGTVRIYSTETEETIALLEEPASNGIFAGVAFHPNMPVLATLGEKGTVIRVWDLNVATLLGVVPAQPSMHYSNAKVVLAGESGVGKSGLALVLTGQPYTHTGSTHGRYVRNFDKYEKLLAKGRTESRETMLWDLAGQPSYRLIHQLHLSEVAVALVVFDAHSTIDPFAGISHWVRALRIAQQVQGNIAIPLKKLLVAARIDRGKVKVSRERIDALITKWGFDGYFETSALEGLGIAPLADAIKQAIEWDKLPKVTSTDLFQRIKTFLVDQKEDGRLLSTSDDLYREFFLHSQKTTDESMDLQAEFETCIVLVESQGLIRRLTFGNLVLLQPEILDAYASALINAARTEPDELGSIAEEQVKAGGFFIPEGERISNKEQEKLLLIAMIEDLLQHEIALREQGLDGIYLVFPSEAVRENPDLPNPDGKSVIFEFEGPVQNIYATLAVRLSHSGLFTKKELWKDAITYNARVGGICGIFLQETGEGYGTLTLFFDNVTSEETRFQFEEYVRTHLERRVLPETISRRRIFICDGCGWVVTDQTVQMLAKRGANMLVVRSVSF